MKLTCLHFFIEEHGWQTVIKYGRQPVVRIKMRNNNFTKHKKIKNKFIIKGSWTSEMGLARRVTQLNILCSASRLIKLGSNVISDIEGDMDRNDVAIITDRVGARKK